MHGRGGLPGARFVVVLPRAGTAWTSPSAAATTTAAAEAARVPGQAARR